MTGFLKTLEFASYPQVRWLINLSKEKIAPEDWEYEAGLFAVQDAENPVSVQETVDAEIITKRQASQMIDAMKMAPKKPVAPKSPAKSEIEAGMYRMGAVIFKVQRAVHGSGKMYAKRLVPVGSDWVFEYAPGLVSKLGPEHKMTLEQAKEFGALYGTCCVCGRTLTREESIEAGIGPICASKGEWA